MVDFGSLQNSS